MQERGVRRMAGPSSIAISDRDRRDRHRAGVRLQKWKPLPQVETTDDILKAYPQFLVVAQRAWFLDLNATRQFTAEKLAK
jgi:hypothetical protein